MGPFFRDRRDAGRQLASAVGDLRGRDDVTVLALPRGGVPVAAEVAAAIGAPLDVFLVRKLGVPGHSELAMGAIAEGGIRILNDDVVAQLGITPEAMERVAGEELRVLTDRAALYRGGRPLAGVGGRTVVLVDDGLATGATMRAAVTALRSHGPAAVVVAVPVGAATTCTRLAELADRVECFRRPEPFHAVGLWYEVFDQTTDDEVRAVLASAHCGRTGREA